MRYIMLAIVLGVVGLTLAFGQASTEPEEKVIKAALDSYTAAFNKGDLDSLLASFAADADFTDNDGKQSRGKAAMADLLNRALAEFKGQQLKATITSLHMLRPDVAMTDGQVDITAQDGATDSGRFVAVWTKSNGKWLLSSIHNLPNAQTVSAAASPQLKQLEWLVGDWVPQDPKSSVRINGRWTLNQSFLLLEYAVKGKQDEDLSVVQYFAWDPIQEVITSWFFDSRGGYGGGDCVREANTWTAEWSGVLPQGRRGSSVNSITFIDNKSFAFKSVDREIDGVPMADIDMKFIRKATGQ
jgi:uncharacterized protein (TIGR02246 family)